MQHSKMAKVALPKTTKVALPKTTKVQAYKTAKVMFPVAHLHLASAAMVTKSTIEMKLETFLAS